MSINFFDLTLTTSHFYILTTFYYVAFFSPLLCSGYISMMFSSLKFIFCAREYQFYSIVICGVQSRLFYLFFVYSFSLDVTLVYYLSRQLFTSSSLSAHSLRDYLYTIVRVLNSTHSMIASYLFEGKHALTFHVCFQASRKWNILFFSSFILRRGFLKHLDL